MPNHLVHENSPYLLQHAENPVDWYPWGEEALAKARAEDKPIFLSIGYAACHWCHVMAHESFEHPAIAAQMNEHFVNIKVDREERPDLDSIYMQAVVALTGRGGWPMSVFLSPDGKPFYGGTYFPPVRRYNMPSFGELIETIARLWREDRARLLASSEQITQHLLQQTFLEPASGTLSFQAFNQVTQTLAQSYDWENGGWGQAPKFPQPMAIEYLLRRSTRGDKMALEIAVHALRSMAKGGVYDVVGGGFSRYSTDDFWRTPHFEKMLYDNAQLALVYLHGWLVTGEKEFRRVCEETLDFVLREMAHPAGGFYSSLDADSEGEEGKFYVWTPDDVRAALVDPQDFALFTAAYPVTANGNFDGKNVLQRAVDDEQLAARFDLSAETIPNKLSELHRRLLAARAIRVRPGTDDKILVAWNALALIAFAEAGRTLHREDYLLAAQRSAHFLLENLVWQGRLMRSWRDGTPGETLRPRHNAYLEDYAALILGLLALYQSDANLGWYTAALELAGEIIAHYTDPSAAGGFFDTRDDHEALLYRPKELQDNATPSGNALAACALLQLAAYEGRRDWREAAEAMLAALQTLMTRHPTAFAQWLCAADLALGPIDEVAILGEIQDPRTHALCAALWNNYRPRQVAAISAYPPGPGSPALLLDRPLHQKIPTAYVCRDFVCQLPVNTPEEMLAQLATLPHNPG